MCGIAGFTRPDALAPGVVAAMTSALALRGPDAEGTHIDRDIAFGHRRLAVIDLAGGAQPRIDAASGDALVFNGEIYGYRALADGLRGDGVSLRDDSDTEVLFQLLRRYGVAATLERIDGMFAFAYREGANGRLHLVRDRFGEKPLYYAERNGQIIFASEVKALRRHPALTDLTLDPRHVYRFLFFDYLPGAETGFAGIRKVLPGHVVTVEPDGCIGIAAYWRPRFGGAPRNLDKSAALDRLDGLVATSVRRRLVADVPIGLFLSGGVDSGLLAAVAARHVRNLTAYTVRMPDATFDETPHAATVARHCGLRHEIVDLTGRDVLDAFDAIGEQLDDLLADSSLLPTYLVCRAARRTLTVALGGDGGDELFAGYTPFKLARLAPLMSMVPHAAGTLMRALLGHLHPSDGYMNARFLAEQLSHGLGHPVDRQLFYWMASFSEDDQDRLWTRDALPAVGRSELFHAIDAFLFEPGVPSDTVDRMSYLFTTTYLPENILAKVDRASMYNSLEVRAPFLDRQLAEFAMSLPARWKVQGWTTKHLLKRLACRYLPHNVVHRPKHGFALPLADLLRGPLFAPVSETLLDPGNPVVKWFQRDAIETILRRHKEGHDLRKKIWPLYVLFRVAARSARSATAA